MSSAGSPVWASSQSRTPRSPSRPDQEVAHAEVAVHRHRWPARRAVGGQPAHAQLERGPDLAEGVEEGQRIAQRVGRRQALDRRRVDGVDGGQRGARPGRSGRAGRRPIRRHAGSCGGSSPPPGAPSPASSPRSRRASPRAITPGTGTPAPAAARAGPLPSAPALGPVPPRSICTIRRRGVTVAVGRARMHW